MQQGPLLLLCASCFPRCRRAVDRLLKPLLQAGGVRVRQHVNPLKKELQVPTEPPAWAEAYADPSRPLVLDVGCGYGRFLLALSTCAAACFAGFSSA